MVDIEAKGRARATTCQDGMSKAEILHCQAFGYMFGMDGVEIDVDKAVSLFWKSADLGCLESAVVLGVLYLGDAEKFGLKRNVTESARCFDYAAARGSHDAEAYLAKCYVDGIGVQQDLMRAKDLYAKAAKGGCVGAIRGLSRVCVLLGVRDEGIGMLDDEAEIFNIH